MKRITITALLALLCLASCKHIDPEEDTPEQLSLPGLALMFSRLPMDGAHLHEVHDAVRSSSSNGYDEEYTMSRLLTSPGAGVGEPLTRADTAYANPLRNLVRDYLEGEALTRGPVDGLLQQLQQSDYQLYWPYSENWDGVSFPIITFDPGYGAETNYGYLVGMDEDGLHFSEKVIVDEATAKLRPVWVINSNSDAAFTPLDLFEGSPGLSVMARKAEGMQLRPAARQLRNGADTAEGSSAALLSRPRKLMMKSFKMLRNYDTWFCGASEFWIKCGSIEGFSASTEAELKLFSPSITEFLIVVKRKYVGEELPFEAILVTDFSNQLDRLVFMITEDDGGTRTSWKCEGTVKIQSKSYGFTVELPLNQKDDIVWRGPLAASFFEEEDIVTGRFGDVIVSFELN